MAICCIFPVGMLLRHSVQLGVSYDLLLIVLCYCEQIFIFNIFFHVCQINFFWTIVTNITCIIWIIIIFNVNFWIFFLVMVRLFPFLDCSDGWRLIPFGASLTGWDSPSYWVSTNLRSSLWVLPIESGVLIWVLILGWWLCYEALVGPWVLVFLALVADVVIFHNLILLFLVCLAEEIILLLNKWLLPGSFIWILLRFHQRSLICTCWINLWIQLSDVLRLGRGPFLHTSIGDTQVAAADISTSSNRSWLEVHLGRPKHRRSLLVFLFGIPRSHYLIILTLKFHLLNSLLLYTIEQCSFKLLKFFHFVNIFHNILLLYFHFLLIHNFLNFLLSQFLLAVLLHLLLDSTFKGLWAPGPRSGVSWPLELATVNLW